MTTRTYQVLSMDPENGSEEMREFVASALGEALQMAEAEDAGIRTRTYGICPEDYKQAREEGIEFNEADGLLV